MHRLLAVLVLVAATLVSVGAALAEELTVTIIQADARDALSLRLAEQRLALELRAEERAEAQAFAQAVSVQVQTLHGFWGEFQRQSDRCVREGGFVDEGELQSLSQRYRAAVEAFGARASLAGLVTPENGRLAALQAVADQADRTVHAAVGRLQFRIRTPAGQLSLLRGQDLLDAPDAEPSMNMDTILQYLSRDPSERELEVPAPARLHTKALMMRLATLISTRLYAAYHDRDADLGVGANEEATRMLQGVRTQEDLDRRVDLLRFMVGFLRAKVGVPTGFLVATYVWNAGGSDSGRNVPFLSDRFYGAWGQRELRAHGYGINFGLSCERIEDDQAAGVDTLQQCARCVEYEGRRLELPRSVVFREHRSRAQLTAARVVAEETRDELARGNGDRKALTDSFDARHGATGDALLRRLLTVRQPAEAEAVESFKTVLRHLVASRLYEQRLATRSVPGTREVTGSLSRQMQLLGVPGAEASGVR